MVLCDPIVVIHLPSVNIFSFFLPLQNYFGDPWNVLDFVIVVGSVVDIVAAQMMVCGFCKVHSDWAKTNGHVIMWLGLWFFLVYFGG